MTKSKQPLPLTLANAEPVPVNLGLWRYSSKSSLNTLDDSETKPVVRSQMKPLFSKTSSQAPGGED